MVVNSGNPEGVLRSQFILNSKIVNERLRLWIIFLKFYLLPCFVRFLSCSLVLDGGFDYTVGCLGSGFSLFVFTFMS